VALLLGFILVILGSFGPGTDLTQTGWSLVTIGLLVEFASQLRGDLDRRGTLVREYFGSLAKGQIWLFVPQPALLALTFLRYMSILYSAPIIVALAAIWGWLDYTKKTHRAALDLLSQFEVLLDDLGRLNFEQGGEAEDNRIVRLLDIVPPEENGIKPEIASATILRIKDLFFLPVFWLANFKHKESLAKKAL
jgi:hypothetical protein